MAAASVPAVPAVPAVVCPLRPYRRLVVPTRPLCCPPLLRAATPTPLPFCGLRSRDGTPRALAVVRPSADDDLGVGARTRIADRHSVSAVLEDSSRSTGGTRHRGGNGRRGASGSKAGWDEVADIPGEMSAKNGKSGGGVNDTAGITTHRAQTRDPSEGDVDGMDMEGEGDPTADLDFGLPFRKREEVDYNGEKVIEVRRKGKVVKRYKPLGIEFLYGRTKPTRLYGPLNSKGEVLGSGLAPVPRQYRPRCDGQYGWTTNEVVTKILKLNHWDDIDLILNQWVGRYNRKNFPPLMQKMTKTGALKHSERLFTWMKSQRCYRARNDIYNLMIWLCARNNRVDRARALFREMQEWRCKPDLETYNALINVHGRARQWRESLYYFDRMLRAAVPPSTETYNNLISACGNSGQWQKALEIYGKMEGDGVAMSIVTHNTMLTALKVGAQYASAIDHFEKTLKWGVLPDRVTLNIVMSCFSKSERYDEAVQLFNSMRSNTWDGCAPDLITFTTLMHVYAACGQMDNVRAVFDSMVGEGIVPNIVAYNTLIGAYASIGMDGEALSAFSGLQKMGFEPDVVSYTALINAYGKSGRPDEAAKVFDLMRRRSVRPNIVTYNTLIDALGSAGRLTEALRLVPDMDFDEIPLTVVTICSLIVACKQSGQIGKVRDVLSTAALRKIRLNVNVCNTVLSAYVTHNMYAEANGIRSAMKQEGVDPDAVTFSILINGAAKEGNTAKAQALFDEMIGLGIGASTETYSALLLAYAQQGMAESAHAVLATMKDSGCNPNVITYTTLIHAYKLADLPDGALAVYEEMETIGVELDAVACSALFNVFNRCGQATEALLLWSKWRNRIQFGTPAYEELSRACCSLRDWKTAVDIFEWMKRDGVTPNSTTGNNMLTSLSKSGKVEQLTEMYRRLQMCGMVMTETTYSILIRGYAIAHRWRECLDVLHRLEADDLHPGVEPLKQVLKCLEITELWDECLEVYDRMISKGWSGEVEIYMIIACAMRQLGQQEQAQELVSNVQAAKRESEVHIAEAVAELRLTC